MNALSFPTIGIQKNKEEQGRTRKNTLNVG
jgi:hypothetical protein